MDNSKIVKLTTCDNSFQAHILKGMLETYDIPCALSNENMNNLYGGIHSTFTAVGIYVNEADYDKAIALVAEQADNTSETDDSGN